MKTVLVTGADGFIGSHLAELLLAEGYKVRALCLYNSFNSWGWLDQSSLSSRMEIISGDVRDSAFCRKLVEGIDTVFHLAALIAIPFSYDAPDSYVATNIQGTLNLLNAARDKGVQKFIHTSTSEVYGTARQVPIDENHPLQPQSPYSATKIGADAIAMSFHLAFKLPVTIARPFNTFGPRQSARAVIPTIISQLAAGKTELSLGDLRPTRDFNFVKDTCAAMIAIANAENTIGETINIGSGREISIQGAVETIAKLMKKEFSLKQDSQRIRPENSEVFRLLCDNSKLKKLTGFTPKYNLEKGLSETIDWFLKPENLSRYKVERYNV
jgi:NAD dependent epimerase/dehydratase